MIDTGTAKVRVTTAGGSALAALGEATAKAKDGAVLAVATKVEIPETPSRAKAVASTPSKRKSVAARASLGTKYAARKLTARAKASTASAGRQFSARRFAARNRLIASSKGIRAVAAQASDLSSRRSRTVVAEAHPYAILGATPGFMKPSRARRLS
jgi:hypothetical protein